MQKKISNLPFQGTPEQEKKLHEVIEKHKDDKVIMPVLQEAQEIYGYLPVEVQTMVGKALMPLVLGVATFVRSSRSPKGRYNISICLGTACYVKGAAAVLDKVSSALGIQPEECTPDGKFSLTACRCIGACGLAPVMTINDDVYGRLVPEEVDGILAKYND
ncbi:MAG: NAD(P)H-dependent oxidoreductase subunit E [Anaeromassilibacillus sp.]